MLTTARRGGRAMDQREEHISLGTGSLLSPSGSLRRVSDLIPRLPQTSSATTGSASLARRGASSTGRQLSETAAASLRPVVEAMEEADPEPYRVDKLLVASLPPSVLSVLRRLTRSWNDPVYGHDFEVTGYVLDGPAPSQDIATARTMVDRCMRPARENQIKAL